MKISCVLLVILAVPCHGFQFMSKWKMPTHDPNQEKIKERFGDKSECTIVNMLEKVFCRVACSFLRIYFTDITFAVHLL
jgi:hypothetical protein